MFKKIIVLNLAFSVFYASDVITIDSLFKKQIGLRSVSSLSYLSSGNAYIYNTYPTLVAQPDTLSWTDTKKLSFNQTFIYTLSSKFDILLSGSGSYNQVVVNTRTRSHRYYWKQSFDSSILYART